MQGVYCHGGHALGPFGGLSTGQLMLPAPHGRKEGTQHQHTFKNDMRVSTFLVPSLLLNLFAFK